MYVMEERKLGSMSNLQQANLSATVDSLLIF